jgi:hypothetical protein
MCPFGTRGRAKAIKACMRWVKDLSLWHFYEVLMYSLCARRYAGYKRRVEEVVVYFSEAEITSLRREDHGHRKGIQDTGVLDKERQTRDLAG